MTTDFFKRQDEVFDLTEKVLRLCGEQAYLALPPMANAETDEDLDHVEAKANNARAASVAKPCPHSRGCTAQPISHSRMAGLSWASVTRPQTSASESRVSARR